MLETIIGTVTDQTVDGLRMIAINVLGHAGYGTPQPWKQDEASLPKPGEKLTYLQAVSSVVNFIVPAGLFQLPFMPDFLQTLSLVVKELSVYTREMLDKERKLAAARNATGSNLMGMLVKLSDDTKISQNGATVEKSQYLLGEEIEGNLFLFTAAGFDTTANTLGYAVTILAAYP